jgi:Zn-dependent protease
MTDAQQMLIRYSFNAVVIGIVFFSIIIHEVSHAWVANWLGDDTAKRQNRLSLNPLKHVDPFGQ